MLTFTTATMGDDEDQAFFALYSAVRSEELAMQDWDPVLRDQILRLQFVAQRNSYRKQDPAMAEQFILRDGRAIGWIMISRSVADVRCVDVAILPGERRQGAASQVLRGLQDEAAARAVPVVLSVLRTNASALALYHRLGFQSVGENDSHLFLEWRQAQQRPTDGGASHDSARDGSMFRAHLDTTFTADPGAGGVPLRLAEVVDDRVSGGMEQFSLFFHGTADRILPQGHTRSNTRCSARSRSFSCPSTARTASASCTRRVSTGPRCRDRPRMGADRRPLPRNCIVVFSAARSGHDAR